MTITRLSNSELPEKGKFFIEAICVECHSFFKMKKVPRSHFLKLRVKATPMPISVLPEDMISKLGINPNACKAHFWKQTQQLCNRCNALI